MSDDPKVTSKHSGAFKVGFIVRGDEVFETFETEGFKEERLLCRTSELRPGQSVDGVNLRAERARRS
jgi:hypothetical protein